MASQDGPADSLRDGQPEEARAYHELADCPDLLLSTLTMETQIIFVGWVVVLEIMLLLILLVTNVFLEELDGYCLTEMKTVINTRDG